MAGPRQITVYKKGANSLIFQFPEDKAGKKRTRVAVNGRRILLKDATVRALRNKLQWYLDNK